MLSALLSLSNLYFWRERGYFDLDANVKPLLHTWSLSVEEQFYIFWPAFLILLANYIPRKFLIFPLLALGLLSFQLNVIFEDYTSLIFFLTPFRLFEFVLGASLIWIDRGYALPNSALEGILLSGFLMVLFSAIHYSRDVLFPSYNALVPCVGTAFMIIAGQAAYGGKVLSSKIVGFVGRISYSLYLIHWPIIIFYKYYTISELSTTEKLFICCVSLLVAWPMYTFIEQPFRRGFLKEPGILSFRYSAIGIVLITGAAAIHIWLSYGWTWRIDKNYHSLVENIRENENKGCIKTETFKNLLANCAFAAYGNDEKFDIILIGDSHARVLRPGLEKVLLENDLSAVWVGGGATFPIHNATLVDGKIIKENFTRSYQEIYRKVISLEPKAVILIARWDLAYHNTRPRDKPDRYVQYEDYVALNHESSANAFENSIRDTVELLNRNSISVLMFSSIPFVGEGVPDCYIRKAMNCMHYLIPSNYVLKRNELVNKKLLEILSEKGNNRFLNITKNICNPGAAACTTEINNVALFKDSHHFTPEGARQIVEIAFRQEIDDFLNL